MTGIREALLAYIAAATLLTIAPGLDTALVLRTAATEHARRAALAALGIGVGCLAWSILVAVGLGALLAASQAAYRVLRWLGAAYLVWVGLRMLRHPRRAFRVASDARRARGSAFATGALTNLLNPKIGVFYVSFLPQFVPPGVAVGPFIVLLGAIHVALSFVWFALLIGATRPLSGFLKRTVVVQTLDRLTGALFMAFGLGLAWESRRA